MLLFAIMYLLVNLRASDIHACLITAYCLFPRGWIKYRLLPSYNTSRLFVLYLCNVDNNNFNKIQRIRICQVTLTIEILQASQQTMSRKKQYNSVLILEFHYACVWTRMSINASQMNYIQVRKFIVYNFDPGALLPLSMVKVNITLNVRTESLGNTIHEQCKRSMQYMIICILFLNCFDNCEIAR